MVTDQWEWYGMRRVRCGMCIVGRGGGRVWWSGVMWWCGIVWWVYGRVCVVGEGYRVW